MRQICISAMRSICRAQFAPLGRMGGTINGEIIQEGAITQNYVGKCILWIIKSYFPNAIRISTDRGISIQGRNRFSLIAVAVTHPRFLDVFHLKKNLYMYASLPPPVFSRRGEFFFFPSIFNRANDLIGASRLSIEPTCLLSFMQIATAAIIDNNCRRSIAVSIASSDRIRPFASNKMHDFLSVFERLLTNPRIISRFFDVLFIIYEGTTGDSLSFFFPEIFFYKPILNEFEGNVKLRAMNGDLIDVYIYKIPRAAAISDNYYLIRSTWGEIL